MSTIPWEPAEFEMLKTLAWQGLSVAEIASRMGRSASAIRGERARLGIHTCVCPGPKPKGDAVTIRPWESMMVQQQVIMRRRLGL